MTVVGSQSGQDPRRPDSYDSSAPENRKLRIRPGRRKRRQPINNWFRKIQNALKSDEKLSDSAHKIQVTAREGKVTLLGVVASQAERNAEVSQAKDLAGIGNVEVG